MWTWSEPIKGRYGSRVTPPPHHTHTHTHTHTHHYYFYYYHHVCRYNVDPFDQYTDDEIWAALKSVQLEVAVLDMEGNMGTCVDKYVCVCFCCVFLIAV